MLSDKPLKQRPLLESGILICLNGRMNFYCIGISLKSANAKERRYGYFRMAEVTGLSRHLEVDL